MYKLLLFFCSIFVFTSCINNKRLIYVQDKNLSERKATPFNNPKPEYIIQSNDVLSITVKSSQPEITEVFNLTNVNSNFLNSPGSFYLAGYNVNDSGTIELPTIGKIKVQGLNLNQATRLLQDKINTYVTDATVVLKLISFKISVLGEVNNPGYYYVYNNQATLFEGLGLGGDLTHFGNRKKVKLIRQTSTGSEVALLDLTDPSIMKSKYYYLLPNDVIYVQPVKAQAARGNIAQLGILFSGITTAILILNYINNN